MSYSESPRQPQPVPPIYEPEGAARAIVWAAHHRRREVYVGGSTVQASVGHKVTPGLLDRYLARTGFQSQHPAYFLLAGSKRCESEDFEVKVDYARQYAT